ncbi:DEAD/DEAH box helicase, partial [Allorhizocola rhizosphaerae]|uniref:DEAD/DEAH box helicase n=1 Tax=Allorhizocola rhizosphaerae TaxID=1872709 RepID=UPI0013C31E79
MDRLPDWLRRDQVTHVEVFPARPGAVDDWPDWAAAPVVAAFASAGIKAPWRHQVSAASLAHDGHDVVIATGTGSGKSLAYQLPTLSALLTSPRARVLYLAPTKALAADQQRTLVALNVPGVRPATLDGDTGREQREWVRQHANFVLTNPDLLHHSLLPQHERWSPFLRHVHYVVVDECHSYRGVFGAHVAHVLRRLRRLTADRPVFLLASATSGDPATSATKLIGRPVIAVTEDTAPRGATTFALWEPPLLPGLPTALPPPVLPTPAPTVLPPATHPSPAPG